MADEAIRSLACSGGANCNYAVLGDGDERLSIYAVLDSLILKRSRLYPVHSIAYMLVPLSMSGWTKGDWQKLWYLLNVANKLVEVLVADRLGVVEDYRGAAQKIAKAFCRLFLEGDCGNDPLRRYHEKLAEFYSLSRP